MKNKNTETQDLFKMYQKVVKKILTTKGYKVDFTDDDSFRDWIMDKFEDKKDKLNEFSFAELTQLLMYNSMLQAIAWNMDDVKFKIERTFAF